MIIVKRTVEQFYTLYLSAKDEPLIPAIPADIRAAWDAMSEDERAETGLVDPRDGLPHDYDLLRAERDAAKADLLAISRAIGIVYEADGHDDQPGQADAIVAEIEWLKKDCDDLAAAVPKPTDSWVLRADYDREKQARQTAEREAMDLRAALAKTNATPCPSCDGNGGSGKA